MEQVSLGDHGDTHRAILMGARATRDSGADPKCETHSVKFQDSRFSAAAFVAWRAVYPSRDGTCGYTVSSQNTFWQHFNPNGGAEEKRIDYILLANSYDGTMTFDHSSLELQVLSGRVGQCSSGVSSGNAPPTFVSDADDKRDLSYHYPLWGRVNLLRNGQQNRAKRTRAATTVEQVCNQDRR